MTGNRTTARAPASGPIRSRHIAAAVPLLAPASGPIRSRRVAATVLLMALAGCQAPPELALPLRTSGSPSPGSQAGTQLDGALGARGASLPAALKIGLAVAAGEVAFGVTAETPAGTAKLVPGKIYRAVRQGAQIAVRDGAAEILRSAAPLEIAGQAAGGLGYNSRRYRGAFRFIASPGAADRITLINAVAPEEYLYGVLPAEMASGWPLEALRAQAVAARTYAVANLGRRAELGFDLFDTTSDQVYKGFTIEKPDTNSAVDGTRGQLLTWQDRPIAAFFHASSGGETDDALAVWGEDLPYIRGVRDLDPSPHADWTATFDAAAIERALGALGTGVGNLRGLTVTTTTPHGRARYLEARGTAGVAKVDANGLRLKLGLKSTRYQLAQEEAQYRFKGGGWGHGLGMSQWGARAYASQGEAYRDILARYYAQTSLVGP